MLNFTRPETNRKLPSTMMLFEEPGPIGLNAEFGGTYGPWVGYAARAASRSSWWNVTR